MFNVQCEMLVCLVNVKCEMFVCLVNLKYGYLTCFGVCTCRVNKEIKMIKRSQTRDGSEEMEVTCDVRMYHEMEVTRWIRRDGSHEMEVYVSLSITRCICVCLCHKMYMCMFAKSI